MFHTLSSTKLEMKQTILKDTDTERTKQTTKGDTKPGNDRDEFMEFAAMSTFCCYLASAVSNSK